MNITEEQKWLLTQLIQECAEVQKEATKYLLFGESSTGFDGTFYDNRVALEAELSDVEATVELLNRSGVELKRYGVWIAEKQDKIRRNMDRSLNGEHNES